MKKGEFGFHWIFILVAGGVILLFFFSIVLKQQSASEQRLAVLVVQKLSSLLTGAQLSEGTVNSLDIPQMPLVFICDSEGYSEFSVKDTGVKRETPFQPMVSPFEVNAPVLHTWALPVQLPFETGNILLLTGSGVRFIVVSNAATEFLRREIEQTLPPVFTVEYITPEQYQFVGASGAPYVRLVFLGTFDQVGLQLPPQLRQLDDDKVSGVSFVSKGVLFLKKQETLFRNNGDALVIEDLSKDKPFFFGAMFAQDGVQYRCNIQKIMKRLHFLVELYHARSTEVLGSYQKKHPQSGCALVVDPSLFSALQTASKDCSDLPTDECLARVEMNARLLEEKNVFLQQRTDCPLLY